MIENRSIAVVIPCYNVEHEIGQVLKTVPGFVDHIIAVNDASSDNTQKVLEAFQDPRITVVRHESNRGVGGAMRSGYEKALDLDCDVTVKMDGDGQMKPEYLERLLAPVIQGVADYAKGNRFNDYRSLDSMPPLRRFGNAWLSFLSKFASGYWSTFDVTNGFTAISRHALKCIDMRRISYGYFFETSMLIELNIIGAYVVDIEMPSVYEGETSNLSIRRVATRFPALLAKGLMRRLVQRYVIRDFNILSLCAITGIPLLLFGIVYAFSLWLLPPVEGIPTPAGTVMLAALPIIMGFQLVLTALILDVIFVPKKTIHSEIHDAAGSFR